MAAQGMIRPEGDAYRVVFPYGGQEYEVHSLPSYEMAHTALMCLTTWAMADLRRCLELSSASGGTAPAPLGSPQQLVQELQACVGWYNSRDPNKFNADMPAFSWLMEAAVTEGHASVAQQLLAAEPSAALLNPCPDSRNASDVPLHLAALNGHAAVFRLLLAAAPEAATVQYEHDSYECTVAHSAAAGGSAVVIEALLELLPDAAGWASDYGHLPLHAACGGGHLVAARLLLKAAPHTATVADSDGAIPLHWATRHAAVVQLLLQAAPTTASAADSGGQVPLHWAAMSGDAASVQLLLEAAPDAALMKDSDGRHPLQVALRWFHVFNRQRCFDAARLLLPVSGLSPAQLLDELPGGGTGAQPLYADLAAHFPLSAAEWQRVPAPCTDLGRALPAVLARSDAEAALLVLHLPAADKQRLRLAAMCLGRTQRRRHVFLPAPLMHTILAQCLL